MPRPVIFTGCCWGALIAKPPAGKAEPGQPFASRNAEQSLALKFLLNGATAFVGCTGEHYSPMKSPYNYFGGAMHFAFWKALAAKGNQGPAQALRDAKRQFAQEMPHQQRTALDMAIERKTLLQYTCLGLGW